MSIQWLYLLLAVVLLLPPVPFSAALQKSLSSIRRNNLARPAGSARVWQNWVDFIRAALGVYLLSQCAVVVDEAVPGAEFKALAFKAAVLGLVLLAQTVRVLRTVQVLAPIFYLSGLTLILGGFPRIEGAFAVVVGWLFAIFGKNLAYQLPAMAIALLVAGYVLGGSLPQLIINCALIFLPWLLSVLFRRRLVFVAVTPASA